MDWLFYMSRRNVKIMRPEEDEESGDPWFNLMVLHQVFRHFNNLRTTLHMEGETIYQRTF
jgi:hypothetical protein